MILRQTFRLYPNQTQEAQLFEARRLHAYLFNAAISHRQTEYKRFGRSVSYLMQQNILPAFKEDWPEYKELHSQTLQATLKRVDLAYNSFFQGLRKPPKFQSIRNYSGWSYPAKSGWKVNTEGKHGTLTLNDLGITIRMRGQARKWGIPTTCTIVYRPRLNQWFASVTVETEDKPLIFSSQSDLKYDSIIALDLGTQTAITTYNGQEFTEVENPRFLRKSEEAEKLAAKELRRSRRPDYKKRIKGSRRYKKAQKRVSRLKRKVANQRKNWQHQVTTDIARRYDIVVTEKLETKKMTRKGKKRKRQKAGLNKSILDVGFGTLNQQITYKVEKKGGLAIFLPTRPIKPSQRCPNCGVVHSYWAQLSNRYHICEDCGFEIARDKGSTMVMYNVVLNRQPGLGTHLVDVGCFSSTSSTSTLRHTGAMKQLGQVKRQKSRQKRQVGDLETPPSQKVG